MPKFLCAVVACVALATAACSSSSGNGSPGSSPPTLSDGVKDLATPPPAVTQVATRYGLALDSVAYGTSYKKGTIAFAGWEGLPIHYYDLSALTKPLTVADWKRLVPVLIYNSFVYVNSVRVSTLNAGTATLYTGNGADSPAPGNLWAPELADDALSSGPFTFDAKVIASASVSMAPYDDDFGGFPQFDGQQVVRIEITFPGRVQNTHDGTLDTEFTQADAPTLSHDSKLTLKLQYDPATNHLIGAYHTPS